MEQQGLRPGRLTEHGVNAYNRQGAVNAKVGS